MGWMTFTTSLVSSLVWPMLVGLMLYLFRRPITRLIDRIKTIKWKDLQADLNDSTESLERTAKERNSKANGPRVSRRARTGRVLEGESSKSDATIDPKISHVALTENPLVSNPRLENWNQLKDLILMSPEYAIHLAGDVLDRAVQKAANKTSPFGSFSVTMALKENMNVPDSLVEAILQLQRFRNQVAGNIGLVLSQSDARTYVDNVQRAIGYLEECVPIKSDDDALKPS
jgi:hypothetical protein